jgi:hypothetical protein
MRFSSDPSGYMRIVVIWRSAIVSGYIALAILIGVAYGGHGLLVLFFYYCWAGAWVVFFCAWGWAARAAGRWNYRRVESVPSGRERRGAPPRAGEAESVAQDKVGVERREPMPVI